MASLTDLYPLVRRKCPSVIDLMMLDALQDAYKEFALLSESVTKQINISEIAANTPTEFQLPENHDLLRVDSVSEINSSQRESLIYQGDDYIISPPNRITTSEDRRNIKIVAILIPSMKLPPEQADQRLLSIHGDAIAAGAASKLRLMPGAKWENPPLAADLRFEFTEGARRAFRDRKDGYTSFHNKTRKRKFY